MKDGFVIELLDEVEITDAAEEGVRRLLKRSFEQRKAEHPEDFEGIEFVYFTGDELAALTGSPFGPRVRGWYVDTDA